MQFDEQLEVKFIGTKVVDLPQDHCSCPRATTTTTSTTTTPRPQGRYVGSPILTFCMFFTFDGEKVYVLETAECFCMSKYCEAQARVRQGKARDGER